MDTFVNWLRLSAKSLLSKTEKKTQISDQTQILWVRWSLWPTAWKGTGLICQRRRKCQSFICSAYFHKGMLYNGWETFIKCVCAEYSATSAKFKIPWLFFILPNIKPLEYLFQSLSDLHFLFHIIAAKDFVSSLFLWNTSPSCLHMCYIFPFQW